MHGGHAIGKMWVHWFWGAHITTWRANIGWLNEKIAHRQTQATKNPTVSTSHAAMGLHTDMAAPSPSTAATEVGSGSCVTWIWLVQLGLQSWNFWKMWWMMDVILKIKDFQFPKFLFIYQGSDPNFRPEPYHGPNWINSFALKLKNLAKYSNVRWQHPRNKCYCF